MKRFRFRLAILERLRLSESRARAVALAEAIRGASSAQRRLAEAGEELQQAARDWQADLDGSDGRDLRGRAEYLDAMRGRRADAGAAVVEAGDEVATRERDYSDRARAHRVLVRLRERQRRRWLEEASREEQKLLDELHRLRGSESSPDEKENRR